MANVKNFGLIGVADNVQFGKAGPRLKQTTGTFEFKNAADNAAAALTAAGITSASGNVTLTTGNLVLSDSGVVTLGDAGSLSRVAAGVYQFSGTGAMVVPSGTVAQQPTAATYEGGFRYNQDSNTMEYSNGTAWTSLATGGAAVTNVLGTTNQITSSNENAGSTTLTLSSTLVAPGSIASTSTITAATGLTVTAGGVLVSAGGVTVTDLTPNSFLYSGTAGLLTTTAAPTNGQLLIGSTGVAPVLGTISGTAGNITVTNGAGSITLDLATAGTPVTDDFVRITTDTFGRVTATAPVDTADITALVSGTYVDVAGDTMTGSLVMSTGFVVTLPDVPVNGTDAANKAYVDAQANGLSWKQAVSAATTGPGTLATDFENGDTIDGITLTTGMRILIKDQAAGAENGIYIVQASGAPVRSSDADTGTELDGAAVFVLAGTLNDNTGWTQTVAPVTIGTTAQVWSQFSGSSTYIWGIGLTNSGNTVNVNLGAGIAQLPTDEVGIDLYDSANNPLILTLDGTTRDNSGPGPSTGAALGLLLDGSSLSKSATGLRVAAGGVDLTTMVTGVLPLANGGTNANLTATAGGVTYGTGSALAVTSAGTSGQLLTSAGAGAPTWSTLSDVAVTTFETGTTGLLANGVNTPVSGAVTLTGTLNVANGGTGAATLLDTAVLIGNGTGAIEATADLTFDSSTDTLAIGAADGVTIVANGGDVTITALDTNADINLVPNGTGSVVIGPSGAGLIQSDTNQNLTVQANGTGLLSLGSGGDISMVLPASNAYKVTVSGPTPAQYADGLAAGDLVNKEYVDTIAGSAAGDVKAFKQVVPLNANGTTNIGTVLPTGATVLSVKVSVTTADTAATLSVGISGTPDAYMAAAENDPQTVGLYLAECMVVNSAVQIIATVAATAATSGSSATVVVTYQIAN